MKDLAKNTDSARISWLWYIPVALAATGLTLYSCYKSTYYKLHDELDWQVSVAENLPVLILMVFLTLVLLRLWMTHLAPRLSDRTHRLLPLFICAAVSLYLIMAVRGLAVNDALMMDGVINHFMQGDYSDFTTPGGYLYNKSHQIGYLAYENIMYRLFGESNFRAYQFVNLAGILITLYLLSRIAQELFEDRNVYILTCLLSCGMLYLFVYSTHVYNDIPSLPLQTAAMYLQLRYLKTHRALYEIAAGICLAIGYCIKTNVLISLVAMVMILLLDAFRQYHSEHRINRKVLLPVLFAVYITVISFGMMSAIRTHYTRLARLDTFPPGEPMSTYVAMSLHETEYGQSGWYNGYNARVFRENNYDYDRTDQVARKDIVRLLSGLASDPSHGAYFFLKKFLTQWADASCISMRNLELTSLHVEGHSDLINSIIYGKGMIIFYWIMNIFQTVCFFGFAIYCIKSVLRRRFPLTQSFFILFIFGGMLFHEFWEASSRYTMRYYVFFVPFAAYGIDQLLRFRIKRS